MPDENGNYLLFDVMSREQWLAKLFHDSEGKAKVLCGHDHEVHDAEDYNRPNVRWVKILPLSHEEIDKFAVPA